MAEPFVRPDVRRFLDYLNALPGPRSHQAGPVEARNMMHASRHVADAPVGDLALIRDVMAPRPAGGDGAAPASRQPKSRDAPGRCDGGAVIPLRLYDARSERDAGPVVVFFHGGGFVLGDLDTHEPFCAELARLMDLPVIAVDYRLAPEHPWPAGPEDAIAATRWIAESPEALGRQVNGLVLAGDSAGGNLAIVTALALRDEPAAQPVLVQWPIYPAADPVKGYPSFTDFGEGYLLTREGMHWFDQCYRPDPDDWRYAPLVKSQAGMPPTLVVTASLDPIRDQGRAYAAACVEAGVPTIFREARGNIHGFINLRKAIPSSEEDVRGCVVALHLLLSEALGK
ncbi:MAG TPA: alpha/beta hydrolase [Allosphingosinicella sp.]|nr:alpha/beta hydrolase [Allosphingosinicella sp.]